jgi:hypothetical protein
MTKGKARLDKSRAPLVILSEAKDPFQATVRLACDHRRRR